MNSKNNMLSLLDTFHVLPRKVDRKQSLMVLLFHYGAIDAICRKVLTTWSLFKVNKSSTRVYFSVSILLREHLVGNTRKVAYLPARTIIWETILRSV